MLKKEVVAGIKDLSEKIGNVFLGKKEPPIGMPPDCILHDKSRFTKVHKSGRGRWKDHEGQLYEWDALHGEIEIYTSKGKHIGSANAKGVKTKEAVPGRTINVR